MSNSGFLTKTKLQSWWSPVLRRGSTVNHLQLCVRSEKRLFFWFMLVGLPLEASKNGVSTCFYKEYAQSSHHQLDPPMKTRKLMNPRWRRPSHTQRGHGLCLSTGGLRKCILKNSTGLMVFLMG